MSYRYIELSEFGGPDVLQVKSSESLPKPVAGEVLVKVLATSASFTDTLIRRGIYPDVKQSPPLIPGYDVVGEITAVGAKVTGFAEGDRVAALTVTGSYTEYRILPSATLVKVPDDLDTEQVVSLILSYVTAYQMLTRMVKLTTGSRILVHGAAGAVGNALLQLSKVLDLKVYGTAKSDDHGLLKDYDCIAIDYEQQDFVQVLQHCESQGIDAVFDPFGSESFKRSIQVLHKRGTLVAYGSYYASSAKALILDFIRVRLWNLLPWKPITRFYSIGELHKKQFSWFREDLIFLLGLLTDGKITPIIGKTMKLEEAALAHQLLESGAVQGKIVLLCNT